MPGSLWQTLLTFLAGIIFGAVFFPLNTVEVVVEPIDKTQHQKPPVVGTLGAATGDNAISSVPEAVGSIQTGMFA
jgi:hypothetical protein